MSDLKKGYTFALLATLLMATIFILGKVALTRLTPQFFVAWNFLIAAVPLGIWSLLDGSWREISNCPRKDWPSVIGFAVCSIVALYLIWVGVQHLDPTVAGFISRVQVLVAVFLGVVFLKERFGRWEILGSIILISGLVVIRFAFGMNMDKWFWVMLSGALFFGVTEVVAKRAVQGMSPVPLNFIRASIVGVSFMVLVILQGQAPFDFKGMFWYVAGVGIGGSLFARHFFLCAIQYIEISKAMLIRQMQPLFVFVFAYFTLGMIPSIREWIGGILILTGCLVMIGGRRKHF